MMPTGTYPRYKVSCIRCKKVYGHNKLPNHVCLTPEEKKLDTYWRMRKNGLNKGRVDVDGAAIEWRISKQEVKLLLQEAGITIWDVGNAGDKYCLARYNDRGHYEYGNCRFITNRENVREAYRTGALVAPDMNEVWKVRKKLYGPTGVKDTNNAGGWLTRRSK